MQWNYVLGGGLEPHFRVLFSAIFHGVPSEIAIRGRKWRILAEAKLLQIAASLRTFCLWVINQKSLIPFL
jgi:hypothetical protein